VRDLRLVECGVSAQVAREACDEAMHERDGWVVGET